MMEWDKLLSAKRFGSEDRPLNKEKDRSQFQRDYDRLIFSSPFRRLQNKTQVFALPGSVFVHNRLTHSLEVASVGRSLGSLLSQHLASDEQYKNHPYIPEIPSILATACLAHDLGNPPFGHSGEDAIGDYFSQRKSTFESLLSDKEWLDVTRFEGNANALRAMTFQFNGRVKGGFGLTYSSLASIVKYPCESINGKQRGNIHKKKYGFFQSEKTVFDTLAEELGLIKYEANPDAYYRHPLVYLVEAADDICYNIIDIEDAHRLAILSYDEVYSLFWKLLDPDGRRTGRIQATLNDLREDKNEQIAFLRSLIIGKLITESFDAFWKHHDQILKGELNLSLFDMLLSTTKEALKEIEKVSISRIYNHKSVLEIEIAGYKILGGLLDEFIPAVLNQNGKYANQILKLLPVQYNVKENSQYSRIQSVLDFVSGMTDLYAVDLFKKINGLTL